MANGDQVAGMNRRSDGVNFEGRITALEISIPNLEKEIHNLTRSHEDSTRVIFRKLDDMSTAASLNRPMDAKVVGAVITIALFVISGFFSVVGYGYSKDIDRIERALGRDHDLLVEHILSGGHVAMKARMEQSQEDRALLKAWVRKHDEKVGGINSKQDSDIQALEREVFGNHAE